MHEQCILEPRSSSPLRITTDERSLRSESSGDEIAINLYIAGSVVSPGEL